MCDNCPDPVLSLLETLAEQYGYALTPKQQPVPQQPKPDPLAFLKVKWQGMSLDELRSTVLALQARFQELHRRDSEWRQTAERVATSFRTGEHSFGFPYGWSPRFPWRWLKRPTWHGLSMKRH